MSRHRRFAIPSAHRRALVAGLVAAGAIAAGLSIADASEPGDNATTTPIKHVVVIFQENTSFDHVFGTYPNAVNAPGEIPFTPAPGTQPINGLTPTLLTANPNAGNPKRIAPSDVIPTIGCSNDHGYTAEQRAANGGLMDKFIENTQGGGCGKSGVLNYTDGNTTGALWNYANRYAMSDAHFGTGFGPSTIGAIELVSGNTATAIDDAGLPMASMAGTVNNGTIYSNANPYPSYDGCTAASHFYALGDKTGAAALGAGNTSKNVGDLLNAKGVSWGWFQGGFTPTSRQAVSAEFPHGRPVCGAAHRNVAGALVGDYDAHHNPFAYYRSTANPEHLPPTAAIGSSDQANHQYDLTSFDAAVAAGALPAVSFLKAGHYQDGHPGYSDPIDEQQFLVEKINAIQASPDWASTAIVVAWDDSDGWYDHVTPPNVRASATPEDALNGPGKCGTPGPLVPRASNRCGYGPRLPLLVISPYAVPNKVKHTANDQTSVLRFIQDNWSLGRIGNGSTDAAAEPLDTMFDFTGPTRNGKLLLDPATGAAPGTARIPFPPTPTPAASATPTPAPLATPTPAQSTPTPSPTPPAPLPLPAASLSKLTVKAKRATSKTIRVDLGVKSKPSLKTSIRVRLNKGKTQVATGTATFKGKTLRITLKSKKAIKAGKYSLVITISQPGRLPTAVTKSVKL